MAREFSGSGQYLEHGAPVVTLVPITMAAWFRPDATSGAFSILDSGGVQLGETHAFVLIQVNTQFWALTQANSNVQAVSSATLSAGTWYHGCGVFRGEADRSAYINGANRGDSTDHRDPAESAMSRTRIGERSLTLPSQPFDGRIAEVGIWSAALTDAEVAALAKGFSPRLVRPASLVAYWPLIGRASPEIDLRGGRSMTVTGATVADHPRIIYPAAAL